MYIKSRYLLFLIIISFITVSCTSGYKVISETASLPKTQFTGTVLEKESSEPIADAKVWVEGTTIHTFTDKDGVFSLAVPRGYYEIHVKAAGFEGDQTRAAIENSDGRIHDFVLENQLSRGGYTDSNEVSSFPDEGQSEKSNRQKEIASKEQKINKFISYYINDNLDCELVNPQALTFTDYDEETLWVKGPIDLTVLNRDLGYKISITLNEYVSKEYSGIIGLNIDADYFFEEMTPKNQEQAETWEKNRLTYFNGSLRHFLIAMASDKSPLYFGYRLYSGQFVNNTSAMAYSSSNVTDVEKQKYEVVFPNNLNGNNILKFEDEMRIEYVNKEVVDPNNIMGLDMYKHQTSWITLNSENVEFSDTGFFESPRAVEIKGVWRYTPVCKMVPGDYLPEIEK
ncbi:carboxypeptidase-like regulatory domain-containing protein [Gracilimonas sediminicola]|uniref:Carboxypeptidase-like regulatory domain-containing protein n=1 Tax=Gracilimonas sediminicola TaxID=2952158 RepID=A0A9X2L4R3_9BACT|nr:carboxypeptidase-like regulatory domain-containing protein [Gracilimonas sediminicola]MCP9292336.1 carboxypeptidase-like regulatory domain-containing protein [Gracilimonas sediminicola]